MKTVRAWGLVAVWVALWLGQGCMSRCSSDADCVKSCPCTSGDNCTVGLSCKDTFCEVEESPLSCQIPGDFCEKYASKGLCGSKKCANTEACQKVCNCAKTAPNTNPAITCCYSCTSAFTCDQHEAMCDSNYAKLTCDDICGALQINDAQCSVTSTAGTTCSARSCQGFQIGQTR